MSRLAILSLLIWLSAKVWHESDGLPRTSAFWVANLFAALLFGLGHLRATAMLMPLTKLVVASALLLNGFPGLPFGWFYWKQGLESAMVAHFASDIILHVVAPLLSPP